MIRQLVIASLRELAEALGPAVEGTQWHLFGSINRDESHAEDIDLMILCKGNDQADALRRGIDSDSLVLPLHLSIMTFEEAAQVDAVRVQCSQAIFP